MRLLIIHKLFAPPPPPPSPNYNLLLPSLDTENVWQVIYLTACSHPHTTPTIKEQSTGQHTNTPTYTHTNVHVSTPGEQP